MFLERSITSTEHPTKGDTPPLTIPQKILTHWLNIQQRFTPLLNILQREVTHLQEHFTTGGHNSIEHPTKEKSHRHWTSYEGNSHLYWTSYEGKSHLHWTSTKERHTSTEHPVKGSHISTEHPMTRRHTSTDQPQRLMDWLELQWLDNGEFRTFQVQS